MTAPGRGSGIKPTYAALEAAYPRKFLTREALFDEMGLGELKNN